MTPTAGTFQSMMNAFQRASVSIPTSTDTSMTTATEEQSSSSGDNTTEQITTDETSSITPSCVGEWCYILTGGIIYVFINQVFLSATYTSNYM